MARIHTLPSGVDWVNLDHVQWACFNRRVDKDVTLASLPPHYRVHGDLRLVLAAKEDELIVPIEATHDSQAQAENLLKSYVDGFIAAWRGPHD